MIVAFASLLWAPVIAGESTAEAKSKTTAKSAKGKRPQARKATKKAGRGKGRLVCRGKGANRRCRRTRGRFAGHGVAKSDLRTEPLSRPSGWIHVQSPGLHEEVRVNIYKPDGSYDEAALAQLDNIFRCRRTQEVRAVDPRLYEVLSAVYDQFGKSIQLASGFRFQRNEGSRHFHGSAMDVMIPGVPYTDVYKFAESLDRGGMGIGQYPRDGFVHIDFRAPGEPSYRWTDTSAPHGGSGKLPSLMWRAAKPNS